MIISISNAVGETAIFVTGLVIAILISIRKSHKTSVFPIETTNELKGLAILTIVLSHIGYFLVSDNKFLQPLSNYAGVGVDLFLVLSGYGLVASALKKPLKIDQFYLRRLPRIYIPMVIALIIFLLSDYFFLHQTYPIKVTLMNLLGIFTKANLYVHIDSPLWYITFLLINYLIFPIIFFRRFPIISSIGMAVAMWLYIKYWPEYDMLSYYKLHFLAFPVGMALATIINQPPKLLKSCLEKIAQRKYLLESLRYLGIAITLAILYYTYYHSRVGETWYREAITSILTAATITILFVLKKFNFATLAILGTYSFEIYLLHWPLLWRYNFLYGHIPAGFATLIYLTIFVGIGYLFKKFIEKIIMLSKKKVLNQE